MHAQFCPVKPKDLQSAYVKEQDNQQLFTEVEVNSTRLINPELANPRAPKALLICVVYITQKHVTLKRVTCNSFPWNKAEDFTTQIVCPNMEKIRSELNARENARATLHPNKEIFETKQKTTALNQTQMIQGYKLLLALLLVYRVNTAVYLNVRSGFQETT